MDQMPRSLAGSCPQDAGPMSMPGGRAQDATCTPGACLATPGACLVHPSGMAGGCQAPPPPPPPPASTAASFNVDFNYDEFEIDVQGWMNEMREE